eukprot:SAG11_NODE_19122_length_473_cov_3.938503_1_plen_67_part_00
MKSTFGTFFNGQKFTGTGLGTCNGVQIWIRLSLVPVPSTREEADHADRGSRLLNTIETFGLMVLLY